MNAPPIYPFGTRSAFFFDPQTVTSPPTRKRRGRVTSRLKRERFGDLLLQEGGKRGAVHSGREGRRPPRSRKRILASFWGFMCAVFFTASSLSERGAIWFKIRFVLF
ncbi:hypothetical protein CEXT_91401 [Caerostris extrusa]|uniref:Transmembrane protein n=1 Tax=Caerostris extrusa TaxID=172846 RepID=A0AAV4VU62_CAEEX|nr:hypothetical protein CEXT_91401 [Caerostris extrusa]